MDSKAVFLIGTNRLHKGFAWSDAEANAGVFVVRNDPVAQQILAEWWNVPRYDPPTGHTWPPEQGAFNRHILPRWRPSGAINLVQYNVLNGVDGEFIRHAMARPNSEKVSLIRAAYECLVLKKYPAEMDKRPSEAKQRQIEQEWILKHALEIPSWEDLPGLFSYSEFYDGIAKWLPSMGQAVEVGVRGGRSLCYWSDNRDVSERQPGRFWIFSS